MPFYERVYGLESYMENYNNENGLQRTVVQYFFFTAYLAENFPLWIMKQRQMNIWRWWLIAHDHCTMWESAVVLSAVVVS